MAYKKIGFKDRLVEKPLTYNIITNEDGTITLEPKTGEIYEKGTDMNANNMDHIEEGIIQVDNDIEYLKNKVYIKDNFAILEGTIELEEKSGFCEKTLLLDYPLGFNKDNCISISVTVNSYCTRKIIPYVPSDYQSNYIGLYNMVNNLRLDCNVYFGSKIQINFYERKTTSDLNKTYKIMLLKYKD